MQSLKGKTVLFINNLASYETIITHEQFSIVDKLFRFFWYHHRYIDLIDNMHFTMRSSNCLFVGGTYD